MKKKNNLKQSSKLTNFQEIILLGGGKLIIDLIFWCKSKNIKTKIITSPRHLKEYHNNKLFISYLKEQKVNYLICDNINSKKVKNFLKTSKNSLNLSCSAPWIFSKSNISSLFKSKLFNIHSTGLPQNRGGGGFSWQIMMGIKFGYCNLHLVDGGIDTGQIVEYEEFIFPATARKPIDFQNVANEKNFNFIKKFIKKNLFGNGNIKLTSQQNYLSTYWPRLNSEISSWINWSMEAIELEKFICAFDEPYNGAKTYVNNKNIVRIKDVILSSQDGPFHSYQNGIVYRKGLNWICVSLKNSTLIIKEVLDEKKNNIISKIKVGDRFASPVSKLQLSNNRLIYTPSGIKN